LNLNGIVTFYTESPEECVLSLKKKKKKYQGFEGFLRESEFNLKMA